MEGKKILVVYYSRTGNTKRIGDEVARALGADVEQIVDKKKRDGVIGFMKAGKDAMFGKLTELEPLQNDPADYDLAIVGTPVWAFGPSAPVRTYLEQQKEKFGRVAFFLTTGGSGIEKTFGLMAGICGREPLATLGLRDKVVKAGEYADELNAFVEKVKAALDSE